MRRFFGIETVLCALVFFTACADGNTGTADGDASMDGDEAIISCTGDLDCPAGMYCDEEQGICKDFGGAPDGEKECTMDEDCQDGEICLQPEGECAPDPNLDGDRTDGDQSTDGDLFDGDTDDISDGDSDEPEIRCDDHLPCTDDTVNGTDCVYTQKVGYCLIDNRCYNDGQKKPNESCKGCDSEQATGSWSDLTGGIPCDDGLNCTQYDACNNGTCVGEAITCDDSVACTSDLCNEQTGCQNTPDDSLCQQHEYCDSINGCTAGGCIPDATRCVENVLQVCDANGDWQQQDICSDAAPVCTPSGCAECNPGSRRCEGREAWVCNSQGQWAITACHGPDPACVGGECRDCTDGEIWCGEESGDWGIWECMDGGWTQQEDCVEPTPMCGDLGLGDGLECLECPPGAYRCNGLSHQVCDEDGVWQVDPCPTTRPYCENDTCMSCMLGATRCGDIATGESRNELYVCELIEGDNRWVLDSTCPIEAPNCTDGTCEACTPGDTRCDPDNPQGVEICNDDGIWEDDQTCDGGNWCDPETGECTDGWSLHFNGSAKMEIPDNQEYDPDAEFTLEAWILPTELSGNCDTSANTVMEKWAAWPVGTYMLAVCADFYGRPNVARFFAIVDDGKQDYFHSPNNSVNIGQWNHIAVTWTDDYMDMFINGERVVHRSNFIGWRTPNTYQQNVLAIGRLDDRIGWGFKGYIDEIRVSKIARYSGATYTPQMFFRPDEFTTGLWHLNDFTDANVCLDSTGYHDGINTYGATYSEVGVGESP